MLDRFSSGRQPRETGRTRSKRPAAEVNHCPTLSSFSAEPNATPQQWRWATCAHRETLTIAGFALDGQTWDGIFLGRRKGRDLIYAGKVDHGFDKSSETELRKRLKPLIRKTQPYAKRVAHKGIWVEPKLLAEIEYRAKSASLL